MAAQEVLDGGTTLFAAGADALLLRELNLLTTKPFLYVFNADESVLTDAARVAELREHWWRRRTRCSWTPRSRRS